MALNVLVNIQTFLVTVGSLNGDYICCKTLSSYRMYTTGLVSHSPLALELQTIPVDDPAGEQVCMYTNKI